MLIARSRRWRQCPGDGFHAVRLLAEGEGLLVFATERAALGPGPSPAATVAAPQ